MSDGPQGGITWREMAFRYPEFVQWIVASQGGLPEGDVQQEDYERFKSGWEAK